MVNKSAFQVIAAIGILCTGAIFVPISSDLPSERKRKIIQNSNIHIIVLDIPLTEAECYVLKQDRYQIEMLTNLDKIPERGAIIFCIFVKQTNGTGFPVRCFAICPNK